VKYHIRICRFGFKPADGVWETLDDEHRVIPSVCD
jgi:hypothetical protein